MIDMETRELMNDMRMRDPEAVRLKMREKIVREDIVPMRLRSHIEDSFKYNNKHKTDPQNKKQPRDHKNKRATVEDCTDEDDDDFLRDITRAPDPRECDPRKKRTSSHKDRANHSESDTDLPAYSTGDEEDDETTHKTEEEDARKLDFEKFLELMEEVEKERLKQHGNSEEDEYIFDYRDPIFQATITELETLILNDIRRSGGGIARRQFRRLQTFLEMTTLNGRPKDERAAAKLLHVATFFRGKYYDCCRNSCLSFAMYPKLRHCPKCGEPRYKKDGVTPHSTYMVFPLEHRIRLMFSNKERARLFKEYREGAEKTLDREKTLTDYWSSNLHKELREKHKLFQERSDLGLLLSTDGTKVYRVSDVHCHP